MVIFNVNKKALVAIPIAVAALAAFTILQTQSSEEQQRIKLAQAIEQEELQREQSARLFEQEIFRLTNDVRTQHNKASLVWSDELAALARQHSERAADGIIEFKHNEVDAYHQLEICNFAGENLADWEGDYTAEETVKGWMRSPKGHGENMLHEEWQYIGVGYARSDIGHEYVTQAFCTNG